MDATIFPTTSSLAVGVEVPIPTLFAVFTKSVSWIRVWKVHTPSGYVRYVVFVPASAVPPGVITIWLLVHRKYARSVELPLSE